MWLTKNDLWESSSWSSPPFLFFRDIHSKFLTQYDCKEVCAPSQSQVHVGSSGGISSQDGVSQHQETVPLSIPHLNRLIETSFVLDESSASPMLLLLLSPHSRGLSNRSSDTGNPSGTSNLCLWTHVTTVEDSVLRTEMVVLEF